MKIKQKRKEKHLRKLQIQEKRDKKVNTEKIVQKVGNLSNKTKKSKIKKSLVETLEGEVRCEKREILNYQAINKELIDKKLDDELDKEIRMFEKKLRLYRHSTKKLPKSFTEAGLDYILDLCDPENMKKAAAIEQQMMNNGGQEFQEDLDLMMNQNESDDDMVVEQHKGVMKRKLKVDNVMKRNKKGKTDNLNEDSSSNLSLNASSDEETASERDVDESSENEPENLFENTKSVNSKTLDEGMAQTNKVVRKNVAKENPDGTWEDIYGRSRDKDGNIVNLSGAKYIPPILRAQMENSHIGGSPVEIDRLNTLLKKLKGIFNRLSETTITTAINQIEELYTENSRSDMNVTLTSLILETVASNSLAPERLLIECIVLITALHANVGNEIGAHFLQTLIERFDELVRKQSEIEDKSLDNVVILLSQLYNFKLIGSSLLYEIIETLSNNFSEEKCIECLLLALKAIGFTLRKEDPTGLKDLIMQLQSKAAKSKAFIIDNSRLKFMLDVLMAIKNNNMSKIPNLDTTYADNMKKQVRGLIRPGNSITEMNIGLQDLLDADKNGKWWVVGSAWSKMTLQSKKRFQLDQYSEKLLELAKKQRMNTDLRKAIFCSIFSAADHEDAFNKLLGIATKNSRDIVYVILHCCLQEKKYNHFYALLAQKCCQHDRIFKMAFKCAIWDKLKTLAASNANQIVNLSKLVMHLVLEKCLPVTIIKVIEYSEMDSSILRFVRQFLIGVLSVESELACKSVFEAIPHTPKYKMFRESLKLFLQHFVSSNSITEIIQADQIRILKNRVKMVHDIL